MVGSKTDIANLAADLLGAKPVNNIDPATTADEELYNRWYDVARKKVLREHPWNFATKRIKLAASATKPVFGFSAKFAVPSDFIRLNFVSDADGRPVTGEYYVVEDGHIMSDYSDTTLSIAYNYDVTDVAKFDDMFAVYLAHELASYCAYRITSSTSVVERIENLKEALATSTKSIDGQESPPKRLERSRALRERRGVGRSRDTSKFDD